MAISERAQHLREQLFPNDKSTLKETDAGAVRQRCLLI